MKTDHCVGSQSAWITASRMLTWRITELVHQKKKKLIYYPTNKKDLNFFPN